MAAALRLWLVIAALWVSVGAAWAQQEPDYQSWDALAERVENVLAVGAASDAALELLRDQVTSWRDTFLKRKDSGQLPASPRCNGDCSAAATAAGRRHRIGHRHPGPRGAAVATGAIAGAGGARTVGVRSCRWAGA